MLKKISLLSLICLSSFSYAQTNSSNAGSRNDSASCDSTCMAQAQQNSQESNLQQRIIPCISGFTGTRLQTRVKLANGTWGPWTDKDIDNCNCSPTFQDRAGVCPAGQKGSVVERSNWTCTGPKSGVWSEWSTYTNNCYTPCVALPPERQTAACPSGYSGTQEQERTSSCSNGESKPPVWSAWQTVSSNCQQDYTPSTPSDSCISTEIQTYDYSYWLYTSNGAVMKTCTKTEEICYRYHGNGVTYGYHSLISDICN